MSSVLIKESRSIETVAPFTVKVEKRLDAFTLANANFKANFDPDGLLTSVVQDGRTTLAAVRFVRYGTRMKGGSSGAYLFLPDGPARMLEPEPDHYVRIIQGSIRSQVVVYMPHIVHQVAIHHSPGADGLGLSIDNLVNIAGQDNTEFAMRLVTDIDSGQTFYSDLNGLQVCMANFLLWYERNDNSMSITKQMTKRKKWDQLPLQAQFYPMPAMAYIEDLKARLTLATKQPLGVSSLESGHLEVTNIERY